MEESLEDLIMCTHDVLCVVWYVVLRKELLLSHTYTVPVGRLSTREREVSFVDTGCQLSMRVKRFERKNKQM